MCQIFINADPALYATRSRSLRVHGVSTSIRLENMFWSVLEEIGRRDGMTVNQLIARLYDELIDAGVDGANFTSFLRVCCTRYLSLQLAGRIPADLSVPIRSLDPAWVLAGERRAIKAPARAYEETSSSRRSLLRSPAG
jgi:predicted DNA-binding ribbon-helix-helix protein